MRFKHLCAGTQVPFDQNQPQLWSTLWAPAPLTPPAPWRSPAPSLNVNQAKSLPGLKHPGGSYRLTATLPKHFFRFINRKLASSRGTQRLASPCSCGSLAFPRQGLSRGPGRHRTAFEKAWTAGQAAGPYQGARASPPSWPAGPGVFGRSPALPLPSSLGARPSAPAPFLFAYQRLSTLQNSAQMLPPLQNLPSPPSLTREATCPFLCDPVTLHTHCYITAPACLPPSPGSRQFTLESFIPLPDQDLMPERLPEIWSTPRMTH